MSLVINVPVEFTFNLEAYLTPAASLSVKMIDDAGESTFYPDGSALGAVYIPPTDAIQGSYIFNFTFITGGNWHCMLVDGTAADHQILHDRPLFITEGDSEYITTISIDPLEWRS